MSDEAASPKHVIAILGIVVPLVFLFTGAVSLMPSPPAQNQANPAVTNDSLYASSVVMPRGGGLLVPLAAKNYLVNPDFETTNSLGPISWIISESPKIAGSSTCGNGILSFDITSTSEGVTHQDYMSAYQVLDPSQGLTQGQRVTGSVEIKLEMTGNATPPEDAWAKIVISSEGAGDNHKAIELASSDINQGWLRIVDMDELFDARATSPSMSIQFGVGDSGWTGGDGSIRCLLRRPQLESSLYTFHNKTYSLASPGMLSHDPGVVKMGTDFGEQLSRGMGWLTYGVDDMGSRFSLDTGDDWGFFAAFTPVCDAREMVPDVSGWEILVLERHWPGDSEHDLINEVNCRIDAWSGFGGEGSRIKVYSYLDGGNQSSWLAGPVDEISNLKPWTPIRVAFRKDGGTQEFMYRIGSGPVQRVADKNGRDLGVFTRATIGSDHMGVNYWAGVSNSIFSHVTVEQTSLSSDELEVFVEGEDRDFRYGETILWWDGKGGSKTISLSETS